MKAKAIWVGLLVLLIGMPLTAGAAGEVDYGEAVNKAGKQRMLSQYIAKAYFFLGQRVRMDKAREQMRDGLILFTRNHKELKAEIKDEEVQKMLSFVEFSLEEFTELTGRKYNKEDAALVLDHSETLLEANQRVVERIEAISQLKKSKLVNLSGRQRMLSQRIAKFYIAYQAGFHDENLVYQLEKAVTEFEAAMKILTSEKRNTPEINKELKKTMWLWELVREFFLDIKKGGLPVSVYASTDSILEKMDAVTNLYAKLDTVK
jgi:hypothetical protein